MFLLISGNFSNEGSLHSHYSRGCDPLNIGFGIFRHIQSLVIRLRNVTFCSSGLEGYLTSFCTTT